LPDSEGRRTFSGGGPGDGAVGTTNVFAAAGYCGGGWTLPVGNVGEVEGSLLMTTDATGALLRLTPINFSQVRDGKNSIFSEKKSNFVICYCLNLVFFSRIFKEKVTF